ncbi:ATP-binding cassette domain-containing protein [Billgrantia tianxiuensis]|uniref:ATP-binding cassette domain-containing protein n=1 Tax=Billgrantia tianxiuensis TaxID=2497861 RepID=A0A6I6SPH7_9GAMM|nr:ATP-binding cassette domain-containing protein [Halomonas tianxiuensis]QHC51782.1 ATP-binding cassette domain-containing protein [Halomonas tianxiuensis]
MSEHTPTIEMRNVSKHFGSVIALSDISMEVHAGEVMCLLGDNGAGKSTLIKTLSGVYRPTEGNCSSRASRSASSRPPTPWMPASPPSIRTWR